jgi:hypothetical protein
LLHVGSIVEVGVLNECPGFRSKHRVIDEVPLNKVDVLCRGEEQLKIFDIRSVALRVVVTVQLGCEILVLGSRHVEIYSCHGDSEYVFRLHRAG